MGDWNLDPSYLALGSAGLFDKSSSPPPPKPRTLLDEAQQSFDVNRIIAPQQFDLISSMLSKYAGTEGDISSRLNSQSRAADVADVANLGPSAVAAIKASNPQQQQLLDALNQQAAQGLSLGASLDPSLRREIQQGVRSGQTARGMGYGPSDLYEEALTTGRAGEALQNQRRAFASSVAGINQASNVDPSLAVLGRPSQAFPAANARTPSYDPLNGYAQDLNNTNFNAAWSNVFSQRNYDAAIQGAMIGAIGNIIGGAGGAAFACAVAREIFGLADPRWILFRRWLLDQAPAWFRALYLRHGQRLAAWLRHRPRCQALVRRWMIRRLPQPA